MQDIRVGAGGSNLGSEIATFSGKMYFIASNGTTFDLWRSDGTPEGTFQITSALTSIQQVTAVGETIYFVAADGTHGNELWRTDGTSNGTELVADIVPGSASSSISNLTAFGDKLFFTANDGANGVELWISNGLSGGTEMVKNINAGIASSNPFELTVVGQTLFFGANDGTHGAELWKSTGTSSSTVLVKDISITSSQIEDISESNGIAYFSANDGVHGRELWKSDGSTNGTLNVKDIVPGSGSFFFSNGVNEFHTLGDRIYFAGSDLVHGMALWTSDGTELGTHLVKPTPTDGTGNFVNQCVWSAISSSLRQLERTRNLVNFG